MVRESLEKAYKLTAVVFDKTGTLPKGAYRHRRNSRAQRTRSTGLADRFSMEAVSEQLWLKP